jgi:NADPH:quinone reductase-like Zn-dependent oxidoreductase
VQAIVLEKYGDASCLHLGEMERPAPKNDQILVRVIAASINPVDWKIRNGDIRFLIRHPFPKVLGVDFAGIIEQVGSKVSGFGPGDEVFGMTDPLSSPYGSYAEYAITNQTSIAKKPASLSFVDAACIPVAGLTAFRSWYELINLRPYQKVLVNGGSGGVGTFAVQMAKLSNAKVYATCSDTNTTYVKELGADEVYDYRKVSLDNLSEKFDGIFDASAKLEFSKIKDLLTATGTYVSTVPTAENVPATILTSILPRKRARLVLASGAKTPQGLKAIADMITSGNLTVQIGRLIKLAEVPDVHRIAEQGHNRGKIAIEIS